MSLLSCNFVLQLSFRIDGENLKYFHKNTCKHFFNKRIQSIHVNTLQSFFVFGQPLCDRLLFFGLQGGGGVVGDRSPHLFFFVKVDH